MRVPADGRRVRRSAAEWRQVLERFDASGLSAWGFCRREGISRGSFVRWRQRLQSSGLERGGFVEVAIPTRAAGSTLASGEMELSLPGGVTLRWKP
jgi:hypothetical protein